MAVKASVIRVKALKGSGSKSSCIGYGSLSAAGKPRNELRYAGRTNIEEAP